MPTRRRETVMLGSVARGEVRQPKRMGPMSSRTVFLARLIGLYSILVSLAMIVRRQATVDVLTAMLHNAQLLLSLGVITVVAGLAMVR